MKAKGFISNIFSLIMISIFCLGKKAMLLLFVVSWSQFLVASTGEIHWQHFLKPKLYVSSIWKVLHRYSEKFIRYDPVIHHKRSPAVNWGYLYTILCLSFCSLHAYHLSLFLFDIPQLRMDDIPILLSEYGRLLSTWDGIFQVVPFSLVGASEHKVVLGHHFLRMLNFF